jgi:hypothetical protein
VGAAQIGQLWTSQCKHRGLTCSTVTEDYGWVAAATGGHRLVYRADGKEVKILKARYHYAGQAVTG